MTDNIKQFENCLPNKTKRVGRPTRRIIELTSGRVFESLKEASEACGVSSSAITFSAQGVCGSVKGYSFAYQDGKGRRGAEAPVKYAGRGRPLGSGTVRLPYVRLPRKTYDALIARAMARKIGPERLIEELIEEGLSGGVAP